jgi:hypothetical protein
MTSSGTPRRGLIDPLPSQNASAARIIQSIADRLPASDIYLD